MTNYVYHKIDYVNGVKVGEFKSQSIKSKSSQNSGIKTFESDYYGGWLGALWYCISNYIVAVPKKQSDGGWKCYGLGGDGESQPQNPQAGDAGGGGLDENLLAIIFPPHPNQPSGILPSLPNWLPYSFTPGGGLQPGTGGSSLKTIKEKNDYLVNVLELDSQNLFFLENNPDVVELLFDYVYNDNSVETKKIASWAMQYLIQNPFCDLGEFKNQFLGKSDGYDADFDEVFWNNANNYFPPQTLPTWDAFNLAYPKTDKGENMPAAEVFTKIGGDVKDGRDGSLVDPNQTPWNNACALRLSWALNKCDIKIPYIKGQTLKGADGKYYFLGAKNMNMWMRRTFGCANPDSRLGEYKNNQAIHYNKSQIGKYGLDLEKSLKDKQFKGIYTIVTISSWASGHCDLLRNNATCLGNCHFRDLEDFILYCDIWNLN